MVKFSKELKDQVADFVLNEIGAKGLDGVTYTMLLKGNKYNDVSRFNRYTALREMFVKEGYENVLKICEVANGYIFELDRGACRGVLKEIAKATALTDSTVNLTDYYNMIDNESLSRKKSEMKDMASYIKKEYDSGKRDIEIALFSTNLTHFITTSGVGPNNDMLKIKYKAFMLTHYDLEIINKLLLIPAGIRISQIQPCEILPLKNGVRFLMKLEKI